MKTNYLKAIPAAIAFALLGMSSQVNAAAYVQCKGDTNGDAVVDQNKVKGVSTDNIRCMHLSSGDGFVKMADGRLQYMFGYADLTGVSEAGAIDAGNTSFIQKTVDVDIILTTYGLARRDFDLFHQIAWKNLILDESQNIKNPTTKRARAIKQLNANHKMTLTGTPIENRLSELWSMEDFLNPGYLGNRTKFHKNFALPIEKYNNRRKLDQLKKLIDP